MKTLRLHILAIEMVTVNALKRFQCIIRLELIVKNSLK